MHRFFSSSSSSSSVRAQGELYYIPPQPPQSLYIFIHLYTSLYTQTMGAGMSVTMPHLPCLDQQVWLYGTVVVWWCSSSMVVQQQYGGMVLQWYSSSIVVQQYGGAVECTNKARVQHQVLDQNESKDKIYNQRGDTGQKPEHALFCMKGATTHMSLHQIGPNLASN